MNMEPLMVQQTAKQREMPADLALEHSAGSTGLRRSLPEGVELHWLDSCAQ